MQKLLTELKRRNVFKVGVLYLVSGWLLLQAGDVLFALLGLPEWTLKLVLGIIILGFPVALVFSWIYELTPEGIKREKDVDRTQSITPETGQKINIAIGVGLAVAIGLLVYQQIQLSGQRDVGTQVAEAQTAPQSPPAEVVAEDEDETPSIAVLPFVNMSNDADQEFFADGLSDTLMHVLSQVGGLKVAARTSSFTFKGQNKKVKEIAQELDVKTVLEGSVQKAGDRVRVIAQLIDASDGAHLWSANFDRKLEDIFAIQDEIAQEVVAALKLTLLDEDEAQLTERYQPSLEAYEQVILGRQEVEKRTAKSLEAAEQHFKRAIELDPNYSLAYSGLADTYNLQNNYSDLTIEEMLRLAEPLVDKALELDPLSGEAYTSKASLLVNAGNRDAAAEAYERAIALSPSYARAHQWYSGLLGNLGRHDEALEHGRKAFELDPLSPIIRVSYAQRLYNRDRVEEAVFLVKEGIKQNPDFANYYSFIEGVLYSEGRVGEARRWLGEVLRINPDSIGAKVRVCYYYFDLLDTDAANRCADRLAESNPENIAVSFLQGNIAWFQGDRARVHQIFGDVSERLSDNAWFTEQLQWGYAQLYMVEGAIEEAHGAMEQSKPGFYADGGPSVDDTNWMAAIDAAWIADRRGNNELTDALLDGAERIIATRHRTRGLGYGIADVRILTIRGEEAKALEKLREAIDMNWRSGWLYWLRFDTVLEPLRDKPEFIAMAQEVEADMIAQREWYEANKDTPLAQL